MRALRSLLLTAMLVLALACGPRQAPAPAEPALWRISDSDSEIWLYGTVHVLSADTSWRGPRFEAAFASAGELVLETDTASETPQAFSALTQRYGALAPGETLSARLDPAARAQLARVAASLGVDAASLEALRPWFAALRLSVAYAAKNGQTAEAGVETVLAREAERRRLQVRALRP